MTTDYQEVEFINLSRDSSLDEYWVQDRIADNPSIIGLGDLILRDRERDQPRAGRLDLLLVDPDNYRRYEVELQLGAVDESHIIRTIEYWDIEKRRYPQYEHVAVIIAEDITSRFLNVIQLFNGHIPLVAIQMRAIKLNGSLGLVFTKVVDEMQLGLVDDDEELREVTDRSYWEQRATPSTVELCDGALTWLQLDIDPLLSLNYNKYYIGLKQNQRANNFVTFVPKKNHVNLSAKLGESVEWDERLDESTLNVLQYDNRGKKYRFQIPKNAFKDEEELIRRLMTEAYEEQR